MRFYTKIAAAALAALLPIAATQAQPAPPAAQAEAQRTPVTILISIDGFRADYLHRGHSPNLDALAAGGISAAMQPSFPSKTFPNHWTIVTGKRPDRNGIVSNNMQDDAKPGVKFTMEDSKDPFWWNAAEPVWVTAEKAGIRTATMFWPGSNVGWGGTMADEWPHDVTGGTRPEDWWPFEITIPATQRADGVLDWMRRPDANRPRFATLYFDDVDTAGHKFGPLTPETDAAVEKVDAAVGMLVAGLKDMGQPVNLVIVADHGMAPTTFKRVIPIDTIANPADYTLFENGPFASLYPVPGHEAALEKALLRPHDHLQCWRKSEIPERFHYGKNPRVPPYFCLAETGWLATKTTPKAEGDRGNHGYDNMSPEMAALFIGNGPAFPAGRTLESFDNVDVAPLIRDLLGLPAGIDLDGDDAPFRGLLIK